MDASLPPNGDTLPDATKRYTNGRQAALQRLDSMMSDPHNLVALGQSMQEKFEENPLGFFQAVVVPLIPKQMTEGQTDEDPLRIRDELREMNDSIATEPDPEEGDA